MLLLQSSVVLRILKHMRRRTKQSGNHWLRGSSRILLYVSYLLIWKL